MSKRSATQLISSAGTTKRQKVASGSSEPGSGQAIDIAPEHALAVDGKEAFVTEVMAPAPAAAVLSQTAVFHYIRDKGTVGELKDMCLEFEVKNTGTGGYALPVYQWFDEIKFKQRIDAREIKTVYGDSLAMRYGTLDEEHRKCLAQASNYNPANFKESSEIFAANEVRRFYLFFPHSWIHGLSLEMSHLQSDLEIRFQPRGNINVTGNTAVVPEVQQIRWISTSELVTPSAQNELVAHSFSRTKQHNYLDVQRYTLSQVQFQAGTETRIDLDQFQHTSAFLVICLRASRERAGLLRFVDLGPKTTFDHVNSSGKSLLGYGTPVVQQYAQAMIKSKLWPHGYNYGNQGLIVIPFTKDFAGALDGQINGYHSFQGDKERVVIVPDSAGTKATVTLTIGGGAPSGGTLRIGYKGDWTASLAYNGDKDDVIADAINKLPSVIADDLLYSLDVAMSAGTTVVFTVTDRAGNVKKLKDSGVLEFDFGATSTATHGTQVVAEATLGFPESSATNYEVDVFSFYYRNLHQTRGRFKMEDM